jgi:hypothetical protein
MKSKGIIKPAEGVLSAWQAIQLITLAVGLIIAAPSEAATIKLGPRCNVADAIKAANRDQPIREGCTINGGINSRINIDDAFIETGNGCGIFLNQATLITAVCAIMNLSTNPPTRLTPTCI